MILQYHSRSFGNSAVKSRQVGAKVPHTIFATAAPFFCKTSNFVHCRGRPRCAATSPGATGCTNSRLRQRSAVRSQQPSGPVASTYASEAPRPSAERPSWARSGSDWPTADRSLRAIEMSKQTLAGGKGRSSSRPFAAVDRGAASLRPSRRRTKQSVAAADSLADQLLDQWRDGVDIAFVDEPARSVDVET